MDAALYDPGGGYYSTHREVRKDFYTAPELHVSFGQTIAAWLAGQLRSFPGYAGRSGTTYAVVEMGCGEGLLAESLIKSLAREHPSLFARLRFYLVEKSPKFRQACSQRMEALGDLLPEGKLEVLESLDSLPRVEGIFLSNELVDALPAHLLEKAGGRIYEVYVAQDQEVGGRQYSLGEFSSKELLRRAQAVAPAVPDGGRFVLNLEAALWLKAVSEKLIAGKVITIDYGRRSPEAALAVPRFIYKHFSSPVPLQEMGREDISCPVDFEALVQDGRAAGLELEAFTTLGNFMISNGILERLPRGLDRESAASRNRMKTLFHPEGMGDIYKVLVQSKGLNIPQAQGNGDV